jgi:hypothetical protein
MFKKFIALMALCLGVVTTAQSAAISSDTWYLGVWSGPVGTSVTGAGVSAAGAIDPGAAAWTFTLGDEHTLRVFDCCADGDRFEVFNFGSSLGVSNSTGNTCNTTAECATGVNLSRGDFVLGAGSYSITMTLFAGQGSGNLFFIVNDTPDSVPGQVPEPGSIALAGVALAGLALVRRRKA